MAKTLLRDLAATDITGITSLDIEREIEHERALMRLGAEQYRTRVETARDKSQGLREKPTRKLANDVVTTVWQRTIALKGGLEAARRPGQPSVISYMAATLFSKVDPLACAAVAVRAVMDKLHVERPIQSTMVDIGQALVDEYRCLFIEEQIGAEKFQPIMVRTVAMPVSDAKKRTFFRRMYAEMEGAFTPSRAHVATLGGVFLDFILDTGIIAKELRIHKGKSTYYITANPDLLAYLEQELQQDELLNPCWLPTIIRPKPWTDPYDGGYWTDALSYELIKTHCPDSAVSGYQQELETADLSRVLEAVNAIQSVGWQINPSVLEFISKALALKIPVAGVPGEDPVIRERPFEKGYEPQNDEEKAKLKEWSIHASLCRTQIVKNRGRRIAINRILGIARQFVDYSSIYFPQVLDYRGRIYPKPVLLTPQGEDMAKSLLRFDVGKPIATKGARDWFFIHGANLFGQDKLPFSKRIAWVEGNLPKLLRCAVSPETELFWTEADSPWQALAWIFELKGYMANPKGFLSHIPIAIDGTCNGLQQLSAALRDEIGAKATNLTPSSEPNDIYREVAEQVKILMKEDFQGNDPQTQRLAGEWLPFITRTVAKRPTMTSCYGATTYGYIHMIMDDIIYKWASLYPGKPCPWKDNKTRWSAASYAATIMSKAIPRVVQSAFETMDWLQEVAKLVSKQKLPMKWISPIGLPVLQFYTFDQSIRVSAVFGGQLSRIYVKQNSDELDPGKQVSAVAPNVVHSLDASHLMFVAIAAKGSISHVAYIHDSFGTHAADTEKLGVTLRETFVSMYESQDILNEILTVVKNFTKNSGITLDFPELPRARNFDLSLVKKSPYFFS